MTTSRSSKRCDLDLRARRLLAWSAFAFVAFQLAFRSALHFRPEIGDPEFGRKLSALRSQLASHPERPLILVLGSSRTVTGFAPEALSRISLSDESEALVFNFAQTGAGPVMNLLCLHRLLEAGIKPKHVLLELWPAHWYGEYTTDIYRENQILNLSCMNWPATRLLGRYAVSRKQLYRDWIQTQLLPVIANRRALMSDHAARWLPADERLERRVDDLSPLGWRRLPDSIDPEWRRNRIEFYRTVYEPRLAEFHPTGISNDAIRRTLALCQRHKIRAIAMVLPEGSEFRGWYPPGADDIVDPYLHGLCEEFGVALVDCRAWSPDEDFLDGHHLLGAGAVAFTRRLGEELERRQLFQDTTAKTQPTGSASAAVVGFTSDAQARLEFTAANGAGGGRER